MSPIAILESVAKQFKCRTYLVHEDGKSPYIHFGRHRLYYYAKTGMFRITTTKTMRSTKNPVSVLREYYV